MQKNPIGIIGNGRPLRILIHRGLINNHTTGRFVISNSLSQNHQAAKPSAPPLFLSSFTRDLISPKILPLLRLPTGFSSFPLYPLASIILRIIPTNASLRQKFHLSPSISRPSNHAHRDLQQPPPYSLPSRMGRGGSSILSRNTAPFPQPFAAYTRGQARIH